MAQLARGYASEIERRFLTLGGSRSAQKTAPPLRLTTLNSRGGIQLKGQWIGRSTGDIEGSIILNADDRGNNFSGVAFLRPDNTQLPASAAFFQTSSKKKHFESESYLTAIDPNTGLSGDWNEIKKDYPGINHGKKALITGSYSENRLQLHAVTDLGTKVVCHLDKETISNISIIESETKTWDEYKRYVTALLGKHLLFRGQQKPWSLRTSFHRRERYDLGRFVNEDIPKLHQHLSARTAHLFNRYNPDENGAFFNLVQHHGYPTPLLDWTYSPYVAAFFAFREIPKHLKRKDNIRIFIFDNRLWKQHWKQSLMLNTAFLHLSVTEFMAIDNLRLIPQQSITTVSNISNIENYIKSREEIKGCKYLIAIDIPVSERNIVMQELGFMGITAGAMFPGLDGACEELKEKFFDL